VPYDSRLHAPLSQDLPAGGLLSACLYEAGGAADERRRLRSTPKRP